MVSYLVDVRGLTVGFFDLGNTGATFAEDIINQLFPLSCNRLIRRSLLSICSFENVCAHTHTHMRAHTYIAFVCMNTLGLLGNLLRVAQCSKQKSNSSTRLRKAVASKTQMTGIQRRNYSVKSGVVAIWCKVSNTQLESRVIRFAYR